MNAQIKGNRFDEPEKYSETSINTYEQPQADDPQPGPGNPGGEDDLPIDDYIPLLVIAALGIIVYQGRKLKHIN